MCVYIEGGVRKEARTITGPAALKHNTPVCPSQSVLGFEAIGLCSGADVHSQPFTQGHLGVW